MRSAALVIACLMLVSGLALAVEGGVRLNGDPATAATALPVRAVVAGLARDQSVKGDPAGLTYCTVASITDGDTIRVSGCADAGPIRLILIDSPETFDGPECYGWESTDHLKALLPISSSVGLERDRSNTDRYGRFLRYAWVSGELINERMVRDGYAVLTVFPPDTKYQGRILAAEQEAKAANRGLWPACGGADRPLLSPTLTGATAAATRTPTTVSTATRTPTPTPRASGCHPSYPTVCIPPPPPDLDCGDISAREFRVLPPDPHRFDGDHDGRGCER